MLHHQTSLHCSRRTALLVIGTTFLLFLLIGCATMLRKAGLSKTEADRQAAIATATLADAAAEAVETIKTGIEQQKPLETIAIETGSAFAWKLATIGASTIGAVLSGLLAKWLGTERKITKTLITGIEKASNPSIKNHIHDLAQDNGIQPKLHARVKALT